jgi:RNA polymerase sigma-70 factor (ECF subfamily)
MSDSVRNSLRQTFQIGYAELKARLARQLGSQELATEALHETWLRIEKLEDRAPVDNPRAYVYRAALNTAFNLLKSEHRRQRNRDDTTFTNEPDHGPGPDRIMAAREEWQIILEAVMELSPRQQDVFRETFTENTSVSELAQRHRVSTRTIQADLYRAVNHCRDRLISSSRFVKAPPKLSEE